VEHFFHLNRGYGDCVNAVSSSRSKTVVVVGISMLAWLGSACGGANAGTTVPATPVSHPKVIVVLRKVGLTVGIASRVPVPGLTRISLNGAPNLRVSWYVTAHTAKLTRGPMPLLVQVAEVPSVAAAIAYTQPRRAVIVGDFARIDGRYRDLILIVSGKPVSAVKHELVEVTHALETAGA
jgi:hypothetical protein